VDYHVHIPGWKGDIQQLRDRWLAEQLKDSKTMTEWTGVAFNANNTYNNMVLMDTKRKLYVNCFISSDSHTKPTSNSHHHPYLQRPQVIKYLKYWARSKSFFFFPFFLYYFLFSLYLFSLSGRNCFYPTLGWLPLGHLMNYCQEVAKFPAVDPFESAVALPVGANNEWTDDQVIEHIWATMSVHKGEASIQHRMFKAKCKAHTTQFKTSSDGSQPQQQQPDKHKMFAIPLEDQFSSIRGSSICMFVPKPAPLKDATQDWLQTTNMIQM